MQYLTFYNLMVSHSNNDISPDFCFASIVPRKSWFWSGYTKNRMSIKFPLKSIARVSVQMIFETFFFPAVLFASFLAIDSLF